MPAEVAVAMAMTREPGAASSSADGWLPPDSPAFVSAGDNDAAGADGTAVPGGAAQIPSLGAASPRSDFDSRQERRPGSEFADRRVERHRLGALRWEVERAVPDVGGPGWRSKTGHLLKNQTFFATQPAMHLWDNPTHAGTKTWKMWHGPRLRADAPLMHRLDRLDVEQAEFEAKKTFVNTTRLQSLDRFYNTKVQNGQKELASQWAPHRKARREYHAKFDCFMRELDSMPVKELKKVLTPQVLHADREAMRMISKRIQTEETWRQMWKQVDAERHQDARETLEHRKAFNDMLMDLAGQPPAPSDPNRKLPNNCTPRLEELAQPHHHKRACDVDVTTMIEYSGLFHVENAHALEARFPGKGYALAKTFTEKTTDSVQPGFPPPPPAETPQPGKRRVFRPGGAVKSGAVPVSAQRMGNAVIRQDSARLAATATEQYLPKNAPPAPDQRKRVLQETLVADHTHMSIERSTRSDHSGSTQHQSQLEVAPPVHTNTYPVVVPTVEASMERPGWRPKRGSSQQRRASQQSQKLQQPQSARREAFPPIGSVPLQVRISAASGLPIADRSGHSDPYATCEVVGQPRSRVSTKVVEDSEEPVWDEDFVVHGWRPGDSIVIQIYDKDMAGQDDVLATVRLPASQFASSGFEGTLDMENKWAGSADHFSLQKRKEALAAQPSVKLAVQVCDVAPVGYEVKAKTIGPEGRLHLNMPGKDPTVEAVCGALDEFDAGRREVPHLGNFWAMTRDGCDLRDVMTPPKRTPGASACPAAPHTAR